MKEAVRRPATMRRPVTSEDVAQASGVSRATVSYVLNDVSGRTITPETRGRVLEAARALGYEPNASARALRSGRSEIVVTLVPGMSVGHVFSEELRAVGKTLAERGLTLLILDQSLMRSSRMTWRAVRPAAVVSVGPVSDEDRMSFERMGVPFVDVSAHVSNHDIGRMQAEHLIAAGHTKFGFAHSVDPDLTSFSVSRADGVRQALQENRLPMPFEQGIALNMESAERAVGRWLQDDARPTAICTHNDEIALLLMSAMERRGIIVGEDIALVGADDVPLAAAYSLSTVAIDSVVLAEALSQRIMLALSGVGLPAVEPAPALRLIARKSG